MIIRITIGVKILFYFVHRDYYEDFGTLKFLMTPPLAIIPRVKLPKLSFHLNQNFHDDSIFFILFGEKTFVVYTNTRGIRWNPIFSFSLATYASATKSNYSRKHILFINFAWMYSVHCFPYE